jgi:hypothetical protein
MNVRCAYCGVLFTEFNAYKYHLKVFHCKQTYNDKIICGQNSCPLDFNKFASLRQHIIRVHNSTLTQSINSSDNARLFSCSTASGHFLDVIQEYNENDNDSSNGHSAVPSAVDILKESTDENGIYHDAALFVARLRSNPKLPISVINDIVQNVKEFLTPAMCALKEELNKLEMNDSTTQKTASNVFKIIDVMENPFLGLETTFQQTKYFKEKGYYVEPHTFTIDSRIVHSLGNNESGPSYQVKRITGEFVSLKEVLTRFLLLPGVMKNVKDYMNSEEELICDFKDGLLWKNHPVRLRHCMSQNTVVIPVFAFYDDLETANPLGSHATIHKVGLKYNVIKAWKPMLNAKLENILLSMVITSAERITKDVFDIYIDEMSQLENEGFVITVEGIEYTIIVTMVQMIGDNLGLNGMLGYVESFTANFPCRLCKLRRDMFNKTFVEQKNLLRSHESYVEDLARNDPSATGIKHDCVYNNLPSFHVSQNVFCDFMHDVLEGTCRYVIATLLNHFIFVRKYFTLDTLNARISYFKYDHSSRPPSLNADHIKKCNVTLSAIEMLNLTLALSLMVGDLVPAGDDAWQVYLMLRKILVFCCGLSFSVDELDYLETLVSEFLSEYHSKFGASITLKFHNLTHYPRVLHFLGPLYHSWVLRCEAKHSELKKIAQSSGTFKNISRTLAVRHQMRQAERFMSNKGFTDECDVEFTSRVMDSMILKNAVNGSVISCLLGNYGLFRELFSTGSLSVNAVSYKIGDILLSIENEDDIYPMFLKIEAIYVTDCRDCFLICEKQYTLNENDHYQAFEVIRSSERVALKINQLQSLLSPWPLKLRNNQCKNFISLKHKL